MIFFCIETYLFKKQFDLSSCAYCSENYTFILKAETFTEDLKFLGLATNISFPDTGTGDVSDMGL